MNWQNAIRANKLGEGKSKMVTVGSKKLLIVNMQGDFHATEGLCKHMKWPLSWGGKIEDGSVSYTHLTLPTNREV